MWCASDLGKIHAAVVPPERHRAGYNRGQPHQPRISPSQVLTEAKYKGNAADVWSLGVMLYVMIEGAFPFRLKRQRYHMQKMIGRIVNAEYKRPTHVRIVTGLPGRSMQGCPPG